jgi:hypothetical protein
VVGPVLSNKLLCISDIWRTYVKFLFVVDRVLVMYFHVFMAPWLIITEFGLDDWIYLFVHTLLIAVNYNDSQSIFSRTLLPWLLHSPSRSATDLIRFCTSYIVSRQTHIIHIRCPAISEPHRKHLFLYCICSVLHNSWGYLIVAYVFVAAGMCLPSPCPAAGLHVTICKVRFGFHVNCVLYESARRTKISII